MKNEWKWRIVTALAVVATSAILFLNLSDNKPQNHNSRSNDMRRKDDGGVMRPLCIEGLLDRGSFHYDPLNDHWMSARPKEPCRLHRYSMRNVLTCLESVRPSRTNSSRPLRFIFAGDSRIRQQFYNFLRFLPDYDRTALPDSKVNWNDKRQDRSMFSSLVNVNVTFLWRHLVTPEFISEMDKLASVEPPAFILIGISVHHMVKYNQADQRIFEEKLTQFIPVLNRLTRQGTRVIWTDQYRLYDVQNLEVEHLEVSTANVMHMNRLTRRILKNSGIPIWDSGGPLADEYLRGCSAIERYLFYDLPSHNDYVSCDDYIHTGDVALIQASQILLNHLCNIHIAEL